MTTGTNGAAPGYDVVVVGAGHAGAQVAVSLRQRGFEGSVALVGDEAELPYERPPLSKDYLAGKRSFERILIRPAQFWAGRAITLLLGRRVEMVDPVRHVVTTGDGEIGYDRLVWAGGGSPRRLTCAGADAANVHYVRRRSDVDAMSVGLDGAGHVTVVGGGYIGLEAAAVLRTLGREVTLLETFNRVLARVAGEQLSRFYEADHRAHGVDVRTGTTLDHLGTENGRVTSAVLHGGERIGTDMVVVGIGITPEVGPLLAAGAAGTAGVDVDRYCRTSLPDIYAVGDCASHTNRFAGGVAVRVESVQNATDQAKTAAAHITGVEEPYDAVPWFWSDQYDLRLQTVGISTGHDRSVLRGNPAERSFSVVYLRDGRVIALDCVNAVRDYAQGRRLVDSGAVVDPQLLADPTTALKTMTPAGTGSRP